MDERNTNQPNQNGGQAPQYQPQPQQGYAPPPPPPMPDPNAPKDNRTIAMVGMILGIVSIVISCAWYLAIPAGIAGIVCGVKGLRSSGHGMAMAGIICGAIGIVAGLIWIILVFAIGIGTEMLNSYYY